MLLAKPLALLGSLLTFAIPPSAARLIATAVLIALVALPTVPRDEGGMVVGLISQTAEGATGTIAEVSSPIMDAKALHVPHDIAAGRIIAPGQVIVASTTPVPGAAEIMSVQVFQALPFDKLWSVSELLDQFALTSQQLAWGSVALALVLVLFAGSLVHLVGIGLFAAICAAVAWLALHYNGLAERLAVPEALHTTVLLAAAAAGAGVAWRAMQRDPARLGQRLAGKALAVPLVPIIAEAGLVGSVPGLAWGLIPLTFLTPVMPALAAAALVLQAGLGLGVAETWLAFAAMLFWRWSVSAKAEDSADGNGAEQEKGWARAGSGARKGLFEQTGG